MKVGRPPGRAGRRRVKAKSRATARDAETLTAETGAHRARRRRRAGKRLAAAPNFSVELRPSRIHGIGLFAVKAIEEGTVIGREDRFVRDGFYRWFTWRDLEGFDRHLQRKVKQMCTLERGGFFAPIDFDLLPTCWHINHSCGGNIGFKGENFVTIRDIEAGEELTYDYALVETAPRARWRCSCGSKQCRGVVTGNDWKDPESQKRNRKYFHPYVREILTRLARGNRGA